MKERQLQPEVMDDPALAEADHLAALRGLERINRLSRSAAILWPAIRAFAAKQPHRRIRLLDIATGAGDVPIGLALRAWRAGLPIEFHACDMSERALAHARRRAGQAQIEVKFFSTDVLGGGRPFEGFDIVTSSLFLHHLTRQAAVGLLAAMKLAGVQLILINDLHRDGLGLLLAHFAGRVLTRSRVVREDAVLSVRAAFTVAEAEAIATEAGLIGATIERRWPRRFLLRWRKTESG